MKLIKKKAATATAGKASFSGEAIDRRAFLRRSGIAVGGVALATVLLPVRSGKSNAIP